MHPVRIDQLSAEQHAELDHANRTAKDGRLRIRALIVLLAAERGMVAPEIAAVGRMHEDRPDPAGGGCAEAWSLTRGVPQRVSRGARRLAPAAVAAAQHLEPARS